MRLFNRRRKSGKRSEVSGNWVPPGHFYSPIPDLDEVRSREQQIFDRRKPTLAGINLNESAQLALLDDFRKYYDELPFTDEKTADRRYFFENDLYTYSDAIFLYSIIRHFKPKNIIEIGSGFSSFCIMDTNDIFFNGAIHSCFIEPYAERLRSQLRPGDEAQYKIIESFLQDIDIDFFETLNENDVLVIDSTHVAKAGSDVNRIFFDILPRLNKGVLVHFHDIFYPFEYPENWIYEGRAWNESYMLRAFLQFNTCFEIIFFNTYLAQFHEEAFRKDFPLCLKNTGGSIWLRKTCEATSN